MIGSPGILPPLPPRFAVLKLGRLQLALPLNELLALEPMLDVELADSGDGSVGSVRSAEQRYPVFSLSDMLEIQPLPSESHRMCALVDSGHERVALTCSGVATVESGTVRAFALPECMQTPNSPLTGLLANGDQVLCWTDASAVMRVLLAERVRTSADQIELDPQ